MELVLLERIFKELRAGGIAEEETLFYAYDGGQMFVEYLVKQRGMGGIQDVLKALRERASLDDAVDRVYGQTYDGARRAWLDWLRSQWGVGDARRGA